jgi:hypothetical protein|tara:strand:+ start:609 stop:848 length:240 start_codon:yes stop_codon:yes gene_type:complete
MQNVFSVSVGNDYETQISASTPKEAAEMAVREWRSRRSFFANECQSPAVSVDGTEFTPTQFAPSNFLSLEATDEKNLYE